MNENRIQTIGLISLMGGVLYLLATGILGSGGLALTVIGFVLFYTWSSQSHPGWIMRAYNAVLVNRYQAPGLYQLLYRLCERADMNSIPALYWIPSRQINAFAVGGNSHPSIAITDGMLQMLTEREIRGVLAHELAHLKNGDLTIMSISNAITRLTSGFGTIGQALMLLFFPIWVLFDVQISPLWILLMLFAPTGNMLLNLALSRTREFEADRIASEISGDPIGLASALKKMEHLSGGTWQRLLGRPQVPEILRTHPNTSERIQKLLEQIQKPALPHYY